MKLESGHIITPMDDAEYRKHEQNFLGYKGGIQKLNPGNWFMPTAFLPYLNKMYSFKFKSTDVFIVTYPKCGTTWMQEIVWTMRNNPNLDNPMAMAGINQRCPFLEMDPLYTLADIGEVTEKKDLMQEFSKLCPGKDPKNGVFIQMAANAKDPRTIKSHLPLSMIHPSVIEKCKIIYVARNPKDVCLSYLHHSRLMKPHHYVGTQDTFVDYFVDDTLLSSPYGLHLQEAWEKKDHKNMHFVFYEDMKADPKKAIEDLDKFIGTNLTTEQISNVVDYTSFSSMKKRGNLMGGNESDIMVKTTMEKDGGFFRKGEAGGWKDKLTEEQERKIEKWAQVNAPQIPFKYK